MKGGSGGKRGIWDIREYREKHWKNKEDLSDLKININRDFFFLRVITIIVHSRNHRTRSQ